MREFSRDSKLKLGPGVLRINFGSKARHFAQPGELGYLAGPKGSLKTTWMLSWIAAGLKGEAINYLEFDLGKKHIISVDTENSYPVFDKNQDKIYDIAGFPKDYEDERLHAFNLLEYPEARDKREIVAKTIDTITRNGAQIALIILDRSDHFIDDPAFDGVGSRQFINYYKILAEKLQAVILGITHTTEGDKFIMDAKLYGAWGREWRKSSTFGLYTNKFQRTFELIPKDTRYEEVPPSIRGVINEDTGLIETLPFSPI